MIALAAFLAGTALGAWAVQSRRLVVRWNTAHPAVGVTYTLVGSGRLHMRVRRLFVGLVFMPDRS